jgi:hypothetical protein
MNLSVDTTGGEKVFLYRIEIQSTYRTGVVIICEDNAVAGGDA